MIDLKGEDIKHIVVAVIAVVALIFAVWANFEESESLNKAPSAVFEISNTSVEVMEIVSFDGSASTDPDGTIVEYTWDFGEKI